MVFMVKLSVLKGRKNRVIKLPDELIERWGEFYTSEYVKNHRPDVFQLEFIEFIEKQAIRYGYAVS